jgi:hypothetical protein
VFFSLPVELLEQDAQPLQRGLYNGARSGIATTVRGPVWFLQRLQYTLPGEIGYVLGREIKHGGELACPDDKPVQFGLRTCD